MSVRVLQIKGLMLYMCMRSGRLAGWRLTGVGVAVPSFTCAKQAGRQETQESILSS